MVSGFRNALRQVERGFSSFFCLIFGIFDDFSKYSAPKALRNFKKSSNMPKKLAKNEETPYSTCRKPIFLLITDSQKSNFGYLIHH